MAASGGFGGGGGAICPHCLYLLPYHAPGCPMATPQISYSEEPDSPPTSPIYSGYSPEDLEEIRREEEEMETPLVPPPIHRRRASWMNSRPDPRVFEESGGSAASSESAWERMPPRPRAIRIGRPAPGGRARRSISLQSPTVGAAAPSPPSSPPRSNKRKGNKTPRRSPKRRRKRGGKRRSRKKRTRRRRTKRRRYNRKKRTKKRRR